MSRLRLPVSAQPVRTWSSRAAQPGIVVTTHDIRGTMRRLLIIVLSTVALLAFSVGAALAHPQSPPGEGDGVGALPVPAHQGHEGVECGAQAGAPAFPTTLPQFDCPAPPFQE